MPASATFEARKQGKTERPRLSRRTLRPTAFRVKKWLRQIGVSWEGYKDWFGCPSAGCKATCFFERNPTWTLQDWQELTWEHRRLMT